MPGIYSLAQIKVAGRDFATRPALARAHP